MILGDLLLSAAILIVADILVHMLDRFPGTPRHSHSQFYGEW
jgi:hypothetical protein